ncbi:MAG: GDP-mannose 4,6-dehydratase, partial [Candidatus Gracilibacteria bacterium]|nr:GDP-mannose 4,6-dehydratase [Candidatus Gracilibacteria bacterium]
SYFETHELPVTISNCSNNYGPWQFPEKIVPLFVSKLSAGEKVPVYGDGMQIRDWLHVEDHCSAIDACLRKGKPGERYVFGDDNEKTNLELTKKLIELTGASEDSIEFVKDRPGHDRRYATDSSKAKAELGWKTKYSFDDGFKMTIDWYKSHQDWVERCKSGEYQNYYKDNYDSKKLGAFQRQK